MSNCRKYSQAPVWSESLLSLPDYDAVTAQARRFDGQSQRYPYTGRTRYHLQFMQMDMSRLWPVTLGHNQL